MITCEIGVGAVKRFFKRQRPCLKFKEPTGSGEVMEETNYSYPSGHAVRGWITAMILTEVNPKVCDRVFALAREYAENRVIVGAHWQSDIEASAMLAIMYMTMLRTNSDFQDDLEAAQAEFVQLNQ